jgi:GNAT superfamily N-acetyltransferase
MNLRVADEEAARDRDRVTYESWGSALTIEQYLAREARLRAHAWSRGVLTSWLYCDAGGAALCSCETYRMASLMDGARGETWAVASVYTEPAVRRRGHARAMMKALVERARAAGAHASILFSDVGAPIYERSGYVAAPAFDLIFPPLAGDAAAGVDVLLREPVELAPPDDKFSVWPTADQLSWHLVRARIYGEALGRAPLAYAGARAGSATAIFGVDWLRDGLYVLALTATRGDEAEAVIAAARRVAHSLGLREARLWAQPWRFTGRDDLGGDRVARNGALPMLASFRAALDVTMWRTIPRAVWV